MWKIYVLLKGRYEIYEIEKRNFSDMRIFEVPLNVLNSVKATSSHFIQFSDLKSIFGPAVAQINHALIIDEPPKKQQTIIHSQFN